MKICFLARPSYDRFSVELLKYMRKNNDPDIEGFFITSNKKESQYIKSSIENVDVCETSAYLREHWNEFTAERLAQYEERYDCAPIWQYIYTDRFLVNREYDYVVGITVGLFAFFEDIFQNNKIDFYYSEAIATLQCYIAYIVGKKHGVKYVSQMCVRGSLDSEYHYFIMDAFQHNVNFDKNYKDIIYTQEEWKFADNYLYSFETKDTPPPTMQMVTTKPSLSFKTVVSPLTRLIKRFDPYLNDPYSYMYYEGYKDCTNPLKFYFNYQRSKKYYSKANFSRKYVYYPLHYQPEASTCVCAPKYEKQLFYIDSWAKSLPADTALYVKEHYAVLGHRDPHFYIEMQKYPNVVLIDPWESTRKLIENAVAVTTLTGTAGFEAMLLRKPVFLGGNIVFEDAPGVIKIADIYQNYINHIEKWIQPSREDVIQYLCACIRSYKKGNASCANYHQFLADNIDALGSALYEQFQKLNEK